MVVLANENDIVMYYKKNLITRIKYGDVWFDAVELVKMIAGEMETNETEALYYLIDMNNGKLEVEIREGHSK
jgi:predicted transposase YbfD/YdcC